MTVTVLLLTGMFSGLAASPAAAQSLDEIADLIDRDGSYLDGQTLEAIAADAVERANADGVGFVYLDQENGEDLLGVADGLLQRSDQYDTLIVLDASGVFVVSNTNSAASAAADAATPEFARGAIGGGIDTVIDILGGGSESSAPPVTSDNTGDNTADNPSGATTNDNGGVPWLLILFLGVAVFLIVRFVLGRRRKAAVIEAALAEDRAEIREQLRNNADHVIDLGDRIATADDELRRMYEEAAQTFQDVSLGLDDAATAAEIDALDDRLDRAEWQFDVIEARLDGRPPPPEPRIGDGPPPSSRPAGRSPVPPLGGDGPRRQNDDGPALGPDESVFPGERQRRSAPSSGSSGRSGGMVGGLAKAGMMALLMKMLFGGGLGIGNMSRRTQQRRSHDPRSGGLGGGVLR